MGLFSSKKKYIVNLTVQRMFEEHQIPDSVKQGIIRGIMDSGGLVENMLEEVAGSIGIRANAAFNTAKRENYPFGIPKSGVITNTNAKSAVFNVIANNVGQTVTPVYYTMGPMNSFHWAFAWLVNVHGYDPNTNEILALSASTGHKCYLKDMVATYTQENYDFMRDTFDMGMVEQLGPSPSGGYTPSNPFTSLNTIGEYQKQPVYEVSSVAVEDYVTVTYEFEESPGVFVTRGLTLAMTGIDWGADYHQARYKRADGKVGFFTYMQGSGTYPIIDTVFVMNDNKIGTYYPWIYFIVNELSVSQAMPIEYYDAAKKYASDLGVNYDMVDGGVLDDPNKYDVAQSMLMFGMNPGSKNESCIEYLYRHFDLLHANAQAHDPNTLDDKFHAFTSSPSQGQRIGDNFFSMTLQLSGIAKQRKPGRIGKVGKYTSEYGVVGQNDQSFLTNGPTGAGKARAVVGGQPTWIYRHQVLEDTFEEIAVYGLRADYNIHRKKGYGAGATDPKLLIPMDQTVVNQMSVRGREQALCRGLNMFVSTVIVQETPWYASGAFKFIMLVVAVVITIFSAGSAWQTIVAAAALGATAVVITIITMIVQALIVKYGVQLFVKKFGPRVAIIAAIAAMAVGAYGTSTNATWGESLVAIGNNMVSQSQNAFAEELKDIMQEMADFQSWADNKFNDLEEKAMELGIYGQNIGLEPLEMVYRTPEIRIGEAPDDLYNRTVHSGNIGVTSFDMVENFVGIKLTLPKLAENDTEVINDGMAI